MSEIAKCPFCGSDDVDAAGWLNGEGRRGPECMGCGATAGSVEAWNRRVRPKGMVNISAADLRSLYQAVIDADEEGLAYHAEPMQRVREALERGEG